MIARLWTALLLSLAGVSTAAWLVALMHERGVRPARDFVAFFKRQPKAGRVLLAAFFIAMWIFASEKQGNGVGGGGGDGGGTNNIQMVIGTGGGLQPLDSPGAVTNNQQQGLEGGIQPLQGGIVGDPAPVQDEWADFIPITSTNTTRTLDGDDFRRGFVLTGIGTGETFDFSAPAGASVCTDWKAFGAAEDWIYLAHGDWTLQLGTDEVDRLRAFSFGKVDVLPHETGGTVAVDRWFAPFAASLGVMPEANWHLTGNGAASQFWHFATPSNTLQMTWQNVLFGRDTNTPVCVQMETWPSGWFVYRYDLSRLGAEEVSNVLVGASLGSLSWATNALPTSVTSIAFYQLSAEDAANADRDGDGLSLLDELFAFGTDPSQWDTDCDSVSDGDEVVAGMNPLVRDTDGDGFLDGTDADPLQGNGWMDSDGNGLPDDWKDGWFGTNAAVAASGDANTNGVSNIASLLMGLNPVAPPPDGFAYACGGIAAEVNAWEISPVAFDFARPEGLTNIVSRTFAVGRESPWEHLFVSSCPDRAGGWESADIAILYGLDGEPATNAVPRVSGDSWRIPLGDTMPRSVSVRISATGDAPCLSAPLYLLRWTPRVEFLPSANVTVVAAANGCLYAAAKRNPGTGAYEIPFRADAAKIPHRAGIDADVAAGLAMPPVECVSVSNGTPRAFTASDPLMADLPREGTNMPKRLLFYSMDFDRPGAVSPGPRTSRFASPYPLTSSSLRKSFHAATGVTADGSVALTLSPDVPELGFIAEATGLRGVLRLRGTVSGGAKTGTVTPPATVTPTVCGNPCTNDAHEVECEYPENHDGTPGDDDNNGDGDGDDDVCECGEGGPSLGSFRIRIPFGESAVDENLGYLWTVVEGPTAITPSVFGVLAAQGVSVATNADGTLSIHSFANGGKTLAVTNIAHGVAIPVWNASGRFESQWEVWNDDGDASRIRVRRMTVLGNATVDETFSTWADDAPLVFQETRGPAAAWEMSDNIMGVTRTRYEWRDENEPGFVTEEYDKTCLGGSIVRAELRTYGKVGEGATARRRLVRTCGYDENGQYDSSRTYWCDTDHPDRHARLKSIHSDRQPWAYFDYDASGRETVRIEQLDGSDFPELSEVSPVATLPQWCSARVTVTDYAAQDGDDAHRNDSFEPRETSVYVRKGGGAPVLVSHEARVYTREEDAAGNPLRRIVKTVGFGGLTRSETTVEYPQDSAVPSHLRGLRTLVSNADGSETATAYALSNGCLVATAHTTFNGVERQTYARTVTDAAYRLPLREETRLSSNGALLEWSERTYDDIRRLRSVSYSDGTSETNAYSCCRLLWRRDREGRKVLRSAQTGTDSLYYADEDVWLADVSTNGAYRIVQHFFDGLGRETNTVTYAGTMPGEAASPSHSSQLSQMSRKATTYIDDCLGGHSETVDERGAVTTRWRSPSSSYELHGESVRTNDTEVLTTITAAYRNGGTTVRREWMKKTGQSPYGWTEEHNFTDYASDGRRIEYSATSSCDCGIVTNSVSTYDQIGRLVSTAVRGANGSTIVTVNTYDGATARILSAATTGSPAVAYGYNGRGERASTSQDGTTTLNDTTYETIGQQVYRVATTVRMTGGVTNSVQVRKVQLTGLSDALRSRMVSVAASGRETVAETAFDAVTGVLTSVSQTGASTPVTARSVHGIALGQTSIDGMSEMSYDAFGRNVAVAVSDASGVTNRVDSLEYDQSGNVVRRVTDFRDGRVAEATAEYDMLGREVRRTDALGNETVTAYDPLGRTVSTSGDAYPVLSGFDSAGRKTHGFTTRDGGATWDETQWEFDPASGVNTAKQYADGSRIAYDYTDNGKKTRTTWARGAWKQNAYNARNLVSGTTYSGTVTPSVAYTYEDSGKTASATLFDGTSYAYGYDDRLLNTSESVTVGDEAFTLNRTFDGFRRELETSVTITNVVHAAKTRIYDSENRVCGYALTNAVGRGVSVCLAYDGSYLTNTTYALPGGVSFSAKLSREAGRRNLVTRRDYFFGGQSIYWYSTEYDLLNRPTNATDFVSLVRKWLYNRRSELAAATVGADSYGYAYDSIGNRIWAAANTVTNTYTANSLNQYSSIGSGTNFVYDADGNMTGNGTFSYAYDAENRLVSVTSAVETNGAIRMLNAYDHRNRRIRKTVQRLNSTIAPPSVGINEWEKQETHTFVWDGNNIVLEKVEFASGTTRTFEYFWGADKSGSEQGAGGVEGLLAVSMDGVFYIPCYDHNGNIVLYVSETGSIAAQHVYDPYGNVVETYGDLANAFHFGFSTQYHDRETGMVCYKRRFYRPDLGRWLNRDPIEETGGANLYVFCANNPCLNYDVDGNMASGIRQGLLDRIDDLKNRLENIMSSAKECIKVINAWHPGHTRDSAANDKYRHCVASCEIANACGDNISAALGILKEARDVMFSLPQNIAVAVNATGTEAWLDSIFNGDPFSDNLADLTADVMGMDLKNAKGGCECACKQYYSP